MANLPILWRGSREIEEEPGSPRLVTNREGKRMVRIFTGPYSTLENTQPLINSRMAGITEDLLVREVTVEPREAGPTGPGRMIIQADNLGGDVVTSSTGGGEPRYELEWQQLEKPLAQAPYFEELTDTEIEAVQKAIDDKSAYSGSELAESYHKKLLRGQDTYLVFVPVVRATTPYSSRPQNMAAGYLDNPPSASGRPSNFQYLKTADRAIGPMENSEWERVEEWTGADAWDEDLYKES